MNIFFINGACGVGKTAIIPHLDILLPKSAYSIHDFDELGVPEDIPHDWRESTIRHWIAKGKRLVKGGVAIVVCGYVETDDFKNLQYVIGKDIDLILLYARPEIIRQRLRGRYTKDGVFDESQKVIGIPVNEFIESNAHITDLLKVSCEKAGCLIVDTSGLDPRQVAERAAAIILTSR